MSVTSSRHLPQSATSATFTSLVPATEYVVSVSCVSAFFEGPLTEVTFVTETDPPVRLFVDGISHRSLALFWTPPVARLIGYELTYGSIEQHRRRRSTVSVTLPGYSDNYVIQDLVPATQYVFSLTAVSRFGRSTTITLTGITGTDPPSDLKVHKVSPTWLYVKWTPPVAAVVSYHLEVIEPASQVEMQFSIPPSLTAFNITNLVPTTKYIIRIAAVSVYGRSVNIETFGSTVAVSDFSILKRTTSATTTENRGFWTTDAFWFDQLYTTPSIGSTLEPKRFVLEELETTTMSATTANGYGILYRTVETTLSLLQRIKRLTVRVDQYLQEETSSENTFLIVTEIHDLFQIDSFPVSSTDFLIELEAAIQLYRKSSELVRASQGTKISTMETINDVSVQTVSRLVQMLPVGTSTVLDTSVDLFQMDVIDINSPDVSPKQQLKAIKDKLLTFHLQLRKNGLSLVEAIDRTVNALLSILPNAKSYYTVFEEDNVVVVVARDTTGKNVVFREGDVNVSASVTDCSVNTSTDATMVMVERNLFSWNTSTFGQNVTTPIIIISLGDRHIDNCSMQVDLETPIALELTEQPRRKRRALQERGFGGTQLTVSGARTGNMTMAHYAFDVAAATVVVVMQLSWWDHAAAYRVFFRYDSPPTEELYDGMDIAMEEDVVLAWHRGTRSLRTWIPNIEQRRGKLYVGIQTAGPGLQTAPLPEDYELRASTVSCLSWEYTSEKWGNTQCGVHLDLSNSAIRCNCTFPRLKAVIGASVHFPPNSIDFDKIFGNPNILTENNIVFYAVIGEWALYILLMIILNVDFQRLREMMGHDSAAPKRKNQLAQLSILPPDRMPAPYLYQITVNTGSMFGAGTSSRVGFQIFGSRCKTAAKTLNPAGESLLRGGSYDFIMPMKNQLGRLEILHIWHDNTGGGDAASWFLRDIIVKDMQTDTVYQFVCYDWLSDARGDYRVQKVLHAATQEQLRSFGSLFRENTNAMFYDQHMWTSPVLSPEGSGFSKAERLSCCWVIVNSMMVASAMWFRDDNDDSTRNIVYNLGFIQFTLQELWVSLVTTVMVIPVTVGPLLLFRKEIPAPITAPGIRRRNQAGKRLSRWTKYVAWLIVVSVSIVSSFFVIMYGLDWGKEKSEAWLKSFFLSFCLSSVVAETGQIFILALIAALICNPTPSNKQRTYDITEEELHVHLLGHKAAEKVYPPEATSVQKMKRKNQQRQKFFVLLQNASVLFLFVAVLFFISQQDKDPSAYHASQTLSSRLTEDFDSITTPEDFWSWTEGVMLPVLYPSFWYNGWKMKYLDRQFPLYTEAFRIGPPRLTQIRAAPDKVELDDSINGWMLATGNVSHAHWEFNVTSMVTVYPDCISECPMELPTTLNEATSTMTALQHNHWIDKYTKRLDLELSFYYPSRKLFSTLKLTVIWESIGHFSTSAVVGTHRLFQYENVSDYGVMTAHILFIMLFLVRLINDAIAVKKEGMEYFGSIWNLMASLSILGSAAAICIFGIRYHFASATLDRIVEASGELGIDKFVDFESTFWWDDAFKYVLAAVVFVDTLALLRMVKFNKTIAHFLALPGAMKNDLIGFSVVSAIAFMAFSSSGMIVFGTHMKAFSNALHTNFALFEMLLGRFVAEKILDANRYVGPVYFTFFMICIFILLVNFLVTIICDAIASGDSIDDDYDQDLVDYIWTSFKEILGIHSPPTTDTKTDEDKLSELNANLRKIEDSLDDTLDVTKCLWPKIDSRCEGSSSCDQYLTPRPHSATLSSDTCQMIHEESSLLTSPAVSAVQQQVQFLLKAHEDDAARLQELQNEGRRRAEAILQRKLAERRRKEGSGKKQTIVETAQDLMQQHAADEERLEKRQKSARRLFESKLRQKLAARRVQKKDNIV
ncbi:location of vulva defective 1-like [Branchiostoma floridae x Branchiostoma belcheri]